MAVMIYFRSSVPGDSRAVHRTSPISQNQSFIGPQSLLIPRYDGGYQTYQIAHSLAKTNQPVGELECLI